MQLHVLAQRKPLCFHIVQGADGSLVVEAPGGYTFHLHDKDSSKPGSVHPVEACKDWVDFALLICSTQILYIQSR